MTNGGVSLKPSDAVEGGAVPVDRNLVWRECRFNLFDYGGKAPATTALRVSYVDDDGQEFEQQYSVSDPARFLPSEDGKALVAVGPTQALSKSSNYYILTNALINAGFPENRIGQDISVLDGLYTYNIGIPEPKRVGLKREVAEGEVARERVLSIPSQIHKLPWEKGKGGAKAAPARVKATVAEQEGEGVTEQALQFVGRVVDESGGAVTRQGLAVRVFKDFAKDPNRDAIASLIFQPEFLATLLANGFSVAGEEIGRA